MRTSRQQAASRLFTSVAQESRRLKTSKRFKTLKTPQDASRTWAFKMLKAQDFLKTRRELQVTSGVKAVLFVMGTGFSGCALEFTHHMLVN
jgi:hypothetical protein